MKILERRIETLEALVAEEKLPPMIALNHEDAQRIADAYEKAGRKLSHPIIIIDIEAEH